MLFRFCTYKERVKKTIKKIFGILSRKPHGNSSENNGVENLKKLPFPKKFPAHWIHSFTLQAKKSSKLRKKITM